MKRFGVKHHVPEENKEVDSERISHSVGVQDASRMKRRPYAFRYDALNFAMMCDIFGASDRIDGRSNLVIMDKN